MIPPAGNAELNARLINQDWSERELLAQSPLFSGLAPAHFDMLVDAGRAFKLPANRFLFVAGDPIREAHLLVGGTVRRSTTQAGEVERVIELAQSQQLLAMGELLGRTTYTSSAKTVAPCFFVGIEIGRLRTVIRKNPELNERIIRTLAERQCAIELEVSGHHCGSTVAQRLLEYLISLAGKPSGVAGETTVTLKANKKTIASHIGITPETLSRSLRQLSDSGVIVVEGRNVHIQNAALLNTEIGKDNQPVVFSRKSRTAGAPAAKKLSVGTLINICGRHRVLSQRMAVAWALIEKEVNSRRAWVTLRRLEADFTRNLARLNDARLPASLGDYLATLTETWPRYRQAVFAHLPSPAQASQVLDLSEEILEAANRLTCHAESLAAMPEAHHVNIAGRNRMLTQRICKFFMFRELGLGNRDVSQSLDASAREFEKNLAELRQRDLPCPEVEAQLEIVAEQWHKYQTTLAPGLRPTAKTHYVLTVQAVGDKLLRHVDTAVKLYERLAPAELRSRKVALGQPGRLS